MPRKSTTRTRPGVVSLARELAKADASLLIGDAASAHMTIRGVVPTGLENIDIAIGIGGLPWGRLSMIQGPEGGGKTSFCLSCCRAVQREGGVAVYYDPERKLNKPFASRNGVDTDELVLGHPDTMEAMAYKIMKLADRAVDMAVEYERDIPVLVVVDSITALKTGLDTPLKKMVEKGTAPRVGGQAAIMSALLREVIPKIAQTSLSLLFVSQLRTKLTSFGAQQDSTCGNAPRFYASLILQARPETEWESSRKVGAKVEAEVVKNQVAQPFQRATYKINGARGLDYEHSLMEACLVQDLAAKSGSWTVFDEARFGKLKVQGARGLRRLDKASGGELYKKIRSAVRTAAGW